MAKTGYNRAGDTKRSKCVLLGNEATKSIKTNFIVLLTSNNNIVVWGVFLFG